MDPASIEAAAKAIEAAVGAPYALVHNAGISAAGMVEETDIELWQNMFATHVMGPVALTKALLPAMRAAGRGPHRAGVERGRGAGHAWHRGRTRPPRVPWNGGANRWRARSRRSGSASPILVTGMYDTDIITDAGTTDDRDLDGPYARCTPR